MNFPVQHLSDEAVAAFADGVLATPAHNRVLRHIAQCADCAAAISEQREAVSALRAAPAPAMPAGLLERLRAVPVTTPLAPQVMTLAPDGSPVFAAFGTGFGTTSGSAFSSDDRPARASAGRHDFHLPITVPHLGPHFNRRSQQLALVAVAAAMITVGATSSASAGTASPSPVRSAPSGANPTGSSLGLSSNRDSNELVSTISGRR